MANVELQISTLALLALVQSRFKQGDRGEGSTVTAGARQLVVSQVEVVADTAMHADQTDVAYIRYQNYLQQDWVSDPVSTKKVEFTQSLRISLQEAVTAPDGSVQLQDAGAFMAHARVRLDSYVDGNDVPILVISPEGVDVDAPDPQLKTALAPLVQNVFKPVSAPIKLYGNANYANAGVVAAPDLSRIAVRLELGAGTEYSSLHWQSFYNGNIDDHLNVDGFHLWTVFIEAGLVVQQVQTSMWDGLNLHVDTLRLNGGVSVSWTPNNLSPELDASFNADAINACAGIGDVNLWISSHLVLAMATDVNGNPTPNRLESRAHVDWDANDLDVVECAVLFGAAGMVTGALVGSLFGPAGIAAGAIIGFAGGFFTVLIAASVYSPTIQQQNCVQVDDHDLVCQQGFPVSLSSQGALPSIQITQLFGLPEGLVLSGQINIAALTATPTPKVDVRTRDFAWRAPVISCGSAGPALLAFLQSNLQDTVAATAEIDLSNTGDGNLVLRGVQLLSPDPAGAFRGHIVASQYDNSATILIQCPFNAAYAANPYPCRLLLMTNGGNTIVTLGPIPALDDATRQRLMAAVIMEIGNCYTPVDDWWLHFRRFNPRWLIDPPFGEAQVDRWHQVEVQGIPEGAGVQLESGDGRVVGTARADSSGVARIGLVASAGAAEPGLTRVREGLGPQMDEVAATGVRIVARQVELAARSRLELGTPLQAVTTSMVDGAPHIFALAGPKLQVYSLADSLRPLPVRTLPADGARGFVVAGPYLALAGQAGLAVYSSTGRELHRVRGEFAALAAFQDSIVAVDGERLWRLSLTDLALMELTALQGACMMASTSRHLLVGTPAGIYAYVPEGRELVGAGVAEIEGVERIAALPGLHPRTAVVASRRDGSVLIVDFVDAARPRILAQYEETPRFANMTRLGDLVVEPLEDGTISIATVGRTLLT